MSENELLQAVNRRDAATARRLLERGVSPSIVNRDGLSLIHIAAMSGEVAIVDCLVEFGADINCVDSYRHETPIYRAVSTDKVQFVRALIKRGAIANVASSEGWTPLHEATNHRHKKRSVPMVALLLEAGADPNVGEFLTPLMLSASDSPPEVVRLLLAHGANVNFNSKAGSALASAILARRKEIVALLVEHGADPFLRLHAEYEYSGLNAIEVAGQANLSGIVDLLESRGHH